MERNTLEIIAQASLLRKKDVQDQARLYLGPPYHKLRCMVEEKKTQEAKIAIILVETKAGQ